MSFVKGSQAIYVELSDSGGRKRYLLPNEVTTISKLQILLQQYPQISLVRQGIASITSEPETSDLDTILEIEHLPIVVDHLHRVHMADHPEVMDNFARYSEQLITLINEIEVKDMVIASAPTLADQLRQQVGTSELQPVSISLPSSSPEGPTVNLTEQLRSQVAIKAPSSRPVASYPTSSRMTPPEEISRLRDAVGVIAGQRLDEEEEEDNDNLLYLEKIAEDTLDLVLQVVDQVASIEKKVDEIGVRLVAPLEGEEITGEQLSKWFSESASQVGFDKAFEILAQRIRGEHPEVI